MLTSNTIHSIYLGTGFWFIVLAIAYWKVFTKAGVAGWKGIIPIINITTTNRCKREEKEVKWKRVMKDGVKKKRIQPGIVPDA